MRLAPLLLALAACGLSACASDPAPAATGVVSAEDSNPAVSMDSIPPTSLQADSTAANYDEPVTLVALDDGDIACYLTVRGAGGERTELADFRFCERTDLVGTRVLLTATPSQMLAASCGGDPECRETEQVNLVTGIDPADEDLPPAPAPEQ